MITDKANIIITGYGWISPKGEIVHVGFYNHLQVMDHFKDSKDREVHNIISEYQNFRYEEDEAWADWAEHNDGYGGHVIEMWADDERFRIIKKVYQYLYKNGWVKFGTDRKLKIIEVEGNPEYIKNSFHHIKKIQDEIEIYHGCKLNIEVNKI